MRLTVLLALLVLACSTTPALVTRPTPGPTTPPTKPAPPLPTAPPVPTPTLPPPLVPLPFSDPLTDSSSGVQSSHFEQVQAYYTDEGFVIDLFAPQYLQVSPYYAEFPSDVSVTADIQFWGDSQATSLGLAFRVQDEANYYMFVVDGYGYYALFKAEDADYQSLIDWTKTGIDEEPFSIRELRVDLSGPFIQLYANDILLTTVEDDTFSGGALGFVGWTFDSPDAGLFRNLEVVAYVDRRPVTEPDVALISPESLDRLGNDVRALYFGRMPAEAQITIELQPGDASVLLTVVAGAPQDVLVVTAIIGPDGDQLYLYPDLGTQQITSELFSEPLQGEGEVTLYLPVAPRFDVGPGTYQVRLISAQGDPLSGAVAVIRSGDVVGRQAIDLNLWLVSEDEALTALDVRSTLADHIRAAVDKILNQHNMQLGEIYFFEATPEQKAEFAHTSDGNQARRCQAMAEVAGVGRAWNVVLVDELLAVPEENGEESKPLLGLAPVPGSVLIATSLDSCATVAWELHEGDYNELGATIVHEGSHFLGLAHTTEQGGDSFDLFTDTPECPLEHYDADGSGDVDQTECKFAGGDNFMFWTSDGLTPEFLMSAEQAWTIRRHPLFYPLPPGE